MRSVDPAPRSAAARLPVVDQARGVAILAMVLYHFAWDLEAFGGVWLDMQDGTFWILSRYLIAGSFLFLVGVGLALAARAPLDWPRVGRRLARIAGGAALVTVATFLVIREAFVFFGILHAIALFTLIGIAALRLPAWAAAAAGLAVIAIPSLVTAPPIFDRPELLWIGLAGAVPPTNDFEPLFPWLGPVLLGLAAGRWWLAARAPGGAGAAGPVGRGLAVMGRRSLAIYLIHQPVLIGAILAVGLATGGAGPGSARPPSLAGAFDMEEAIGACLREQGDVGWSVPEATYYCRCMIERLAADPVIATGDEATMRAQALTYVQQCLPPRPTEPDADPGAGSEAEGGGG